MDTFKQPAMIVSIIDAIALIGVSLYFNKRITEIEKLTDKNAINIKDDIMPILSTLKEFRDKTQNNMEIINMTLNNIVKEIKISKVRYANLSNTVESIIDALDSKDIKIENNDKKNSNRSSSSRRKVNIEEDEDEDDDIDNIINNVRKSGSNRGKF